MKKATIFFCYV